jgi:hypothetical protein
LKLGQFQQNCLANQIANQVTNQQVAGPRMIVLKSRQKLS